jgi:hypothetical protein
MRELAPDHRAGVQVIFAGSFAEVVETDVTFGIAREGKGAALVEQRLEADFVGGVHGNL